jgi:Ni2+-binding GTPase involved in maturation of urease and hydrogenase
LIEKYDWARTIAVTGALGSGKSEWVLNLAMGLKMSGQKVTIADADIINPYFCIRQVVEQLEAQGFNMLLPPSNGKWSDMSLISPRIAAALSDDSSVLMLDVGGDASGVRALKQFEPEIKKSSYLLILVVNAFRPLTSTPEKIEVMARRMEDICNLRVGALVCNSHLMSQTTPDDIISGIKIAEKAAEVLSLPLLYSTALDILYPEVSKRLCDSGVKVPLWPLKRYLTLPWEGSELWSSNIKKIYRIYKADLEI